MSKITPVGIICWPNLFNKVTDSFGKEQYSCTVAFPNGTDLSTMEEWIDVAAKEKWGSKTPKKLKSPLLRCEDQNQEYEGCEYFVRLNSNYQPKVIGYPTPDNLEEKDVPDGTFVRASIRTYTFDKSGNKGVGFGLNAIQKMRDGEIIHFNPDGDSASTAAEEFGAVEPSQVPAGASSMFE